MSLCLSVRPPLSTSQCPSFFVVRCRHLVAAIIWFWIKFISHRVLLFSSTDDQHSTSSSSSSTCMPLQEFILIIIEDNLKPESKSIFVPEPLKADMSASTVVGLCAMFFLFVKRLYILFYLTRSNQLSTCSSAALTKSALCWAVI